MRLVLLASVLVSLTAAGSAPTPLYATYAAEWDFSPITTTVLFGVYAIAVLVPLLVVRCGAPGIGTGAGAQITGLLVQYAPAPTHLNYLVLAVVYLLQMVGVSRIPQSAARSAGVRAALVPRFTVPAGVRGPVITAAPILFAIWALAGFHGSLAPALLTDLSGSTSPVLGGTGLFLLAVVGSATAVALNRVPPR